MTADPPVRADGLCALPGCRNRIKAVPPKTMPKTLRPAFLQALASEPFCSTDCCREWHKAGRTVTTRPGWPRGATRAYTA